MSGQGISQIVVYALVLIALSYPLGLWMARVFTLPRVAGRLLGSVENGFYRLVRTDPAREQDWKAYGTTVLVFSILFWLLLYAIQRAQGHLFLNPDHMKGVPAHLSLNTSASFITNTNWQFYGGEYTMSYLTQMAGLAVQNFVSAAVGIAVLVAVVRGIARRSSGTLGNFWVDLYRAIVYVLLPLAAIVAVVLMWQGVPQTLSGHATATTLQGAQQSIARGPVASQIAIKQLGTNGGGFYNSNSAVPFENPTGFSNFIEMLSILLIPAAEVFMFGKLVFARRHASAVFAAMFVVFAIGVAVNLPAEQHGSAVLRSSGVNITQGNGQSGGNMADKEVRFGQAATANWTVATSDASNGSVDSGFDAQTPLGGAVPLVNLFLGEVIFGGAGSGLYGMFFYIIIAVFVAGLMVGRTPEWLGKKIEAREIKYAALGALFVPTMVLTLAAISIATKSGLASIFNSGVHGFTETLYAYDSQGNNNGSAFAGFGLTNFSADLGTVALLLGRFIPMFAALALGGALAKKKIVPASAGTFRTDGPTFVVLLVGVIALTAGLMILPALTLGPIVEGLMH
ncbi:MAG TPA: potassium-transporting ATPase subunit KdpA [Gaiellaceae bacterium]|jgi:K+-transporting ATPase ATPase A chain|nr:potassium-transporting ATPase subunit KdpA [Gaiellaceae bacterium]